MGIDGVGTELEVRGAVGVKVVVDQAGPGVGEIVLEIGADLPGQGLPLPGLAVLAHIAGHLSRTCQLLIPEGLDVHGPVPAGRARILALGPYHL